MPTPPESLTTKYRETTLTLLKEKEENEALITSLINANERFWERNIDLELERHHSASHIKELEAQVKSLESRVRYLETKETLRNFIDEFLKPKPIIEKPRRSSGITIHWELTPKAT